MKANADIISSSGALPGNGNTRSGYHFQTEGIGHFSSDLYTPLNVNRSADGIALAFKHFGTFVGSVQVTATGTIYSTQSDYRLKTVDGPVTTSGAFIDALKPVTGEWKVEPGKKANFFLAHEVQEVSPSSVQGEKDAVDEEGNAVMQSMEYGSADFIVNIIAELQDLRKRVAALEAK